MKRFLSILLVAVMLLGMLPATSLTAFAADTQIEFALGTDGTASHADGSGATTYTEAVGEYTLSITGGTNMYTGARDAKGNGCIKLGTSSKAGSFSFTVPDDVTSVVIYVAAYKANTASITINNGTATALTSKSNDGAYDAITVDTTSTKTVNLAVSSGYRAMVNTITYVIAGGPNEPACTHEGTTERQNVVIGDCTTDSYSGDLVCTVCGKTVENGETTTAPGHNYVDGVCDICGAEEPEGYTLVTDASTLKVGDQIVIVAQDYNYAISTDQKSNNRGQAAVEKNENVVTFGDDVQVLTLEAGKTAGTFAFNTGSGYLYAASSSNNYLKTQAAIDDNASWKIEVADGSTSITAPNSSNRNVLQYNQSNSLFACYASASQKAVVVYVLPGSEDVEPCTHANTEPIPAVDATCASTGLTEGVRCADCGTTITEQTQTPVRAHNMVDGICAYTDCGLYEHQAELMTGLPGNGDKVIIYSSGYAMGTADNGYSKLTAIATAPVDGKLPYYTSVAQVTAGKSDNYYTFTNAEGQYLTSGATGGSLTFAAEESDLALWTIEAAETNAWYITNKAATYNSTDYNQVIEYYGGAFTTYGKGSGEAYQMQLYLVEKGACTCTNTQEQTDGYDATCTEPGMTNSVKCLDCGATVTAQQEIPALGHNYVDETCTRCGAVQIIGNYVLVSNLDEITDGQYVIVAEVDGVYYALNTATSSKIEPVVVTISNNTVTSADAPVWTVASVNGNITLQTGDSYLGYSSSTNFAAVDAYEWIVAAAGNSTFNFTASTTADASTVRGIFYRTGTTNKYGAYATSNDKDEPTEYYWDLQVYKYVQPVVAADGTGYNTIEKAIAAGKNNLKLYADVNSDITFNGDLYLDLNGFNVKSLTVTNGTLYASDSKATTAAASGAQISAVTGTVAIDNTVGGKRYIAVKTGNAYSFHVLEMKLSAVTLRTSQAGIYYKATVSCDPVLAAAATQHGIALSTRNMPGANFATEKEENGDVNGWTVNTTALVSGEEFTSGSVFGIFKQGLTNNAARGEVKIYANAYIMVGDTVIMADRDAGQTVDTEGFDGIAWSLKDVLVKLEETYTSDSLTDDQRTQIAGFYRDWASAMSGWGLTQIANAAANLPAE